MPTVRVWAPLPKTVELQLGQQKFPMTAGTDGWWAAQIPSTALETDYGFILEGEGPFPDPRSSDQPNGPHRLSRWLDHDSFKWTDAAWRPPSLSEAVIYELHVGTFTSEGTFEAAIARLD